MIGAAAFILGQTPALWGCESVIRRALAGGSSGLLLALLTAACSAPDRPSWKVFPLSRRMPHDGLAVVSQPDGYGLHLFLETDTSAADLCTPRWFPDAARLFNGNGTAPFSAGLVPRDEFFAVVRRSDVLEALEVELKALCQERAPGARWQWIAPPSAESEVVPVQLPAYEQDDLLTDPAEEQRREDALLDDAQKLSQTTGSASRQ